MHDLTFWGAVAIFGIIVAVPFIFSSFGDFPMLNVLFIVAVFGFGFWFLLSGCSQKQTTDADYKTQATKLYENGLKDTYSGSCMTAIDYFERASETYPYSDIAKKSLVMEIYCNYSLKNYEDVVSLSELYYKFYPFEQDISYVMFIRAMSLTKTIIGSKRDASAMKLTKDNIVYHLQNFKNSKYNGVLQKEFLKTEKLIYDSELSVAQYYLNANNLIAAAKRLAYLEANFAQYAFYDSSKILKMRNIIYKKLI